ncbi:hypothetical protein L209DRAFT_750541 [Thermothelomyces heterothallicus CBS 203.75]
MCLTRDYTLIPQRNLIEDCALEHAVDFDKLNECATRDNGAFGVGLLRESVVRSAEVRCEPYIRHDLSPTPPIVRKSWNINGANLISFPPSR